MPLPGDELAALLLAALATSALSAVVGMAGGTWLGSRVLDRIDERIFGWLYRAVLTLLALRLLAGSVGLP